MKMQSIKWFGIDDAAEAVAVRFKIGGIKWPTTHSTLNSQTQTADC